MVYLVAKKVLDSIIHQEAMTRFKSAERLFESAAMYGGRATFLLVCDPLLLESLLTISVGSPK